MTQDDHDHDNHDQENHDHENHDRGPRHWGFKGLAVLSHGFRAFFFLAGVWAAFGLTLSVLMIEGLIALPTTFDAIAWHYHEMIFGFAAASIGGFLLTAVPNWTGRLPIQGLPLLGLVMLWAAGRVAMATSAVIGALPAAVIDVSFLVALAIVAAREIIAGKNWRNLPIVLAITLLATGNVLAHGEVAGVLPTIGLGHRWSIAVVIMLISLIGGRVIPSFTRNWLAKQKAEKLPVPFGRFDQMTLAVTGVGMVCWIAAPVSMVTACAIGLAAMLHFIRLSRWCGLATGGEALVWVLHVAYVWIPIGFALIAISIVWPVLPPTGALHALTAGAIGSMTLAVMSRATLGHSGRALAAGPGLTAVYWLVSLSAVIRVGLSVLDIWYVPALALAGSAWVGAFLLFLCVCGPMHWSRKAG